MMGRKTTQRKRPPVTRSKKKTVRRSRLAVPLWRQPAFWGMLLAAAAFVVMVMYGRLPAPPQSTVTVPERSDAQILEDLRVEVESLLWRIVV